MKILLVHGWGLRPAMWGKLEQRLKQCFENQPIDFTRADLGFFGSPILPAARFDIAIGHSLGLAWILEQNAVQFEALVSINGFNCFTSRDDFPAGWNRRVLQRMRKGLATDHRTVLRQFFTNAKAHEWNSVHVLDSDIVDIERLDWGLEVLINWDVREQWKSFDGPQCVIAATNDQIVTANQTEACFADGDIQWIESDSHCLPLKFPGKCAALVRELIEAN